VDLDATDCDSRCRDALVFLLLHQLHVHDRKAQRWRMHGSRCSPSPARQVNDRRSYRNSYRQPDRDCYGHSGDVISMAIKLAKDMSGCIKRWKMKSSDRPHYWHVYLWQDYDSLIANTPMMFPVAKSLDIHAGHATAQCRNWWI